MKADEPVYWVEGSACCNAVWEAAYERFETEEEEIAKFRQRLEELGVAGWSREMRVVDLFCGSGRNLVTLERLGFRDLHGVDLSPRLLQRYRGSARLYVGDATSLRFADEWADAVIVQGGLHHLPAVPSDLANCLQEIRRVLRPGGRLVVVEPWLTPMLHAVHWCCERRLVTSAWAKLQALATMIEEERATYFRWLDSAPQIEVLFEEYFQTRVWQTKRGKLFYVGEKAI